VVDAGRSSNAEIERIFDDTANAVAQAIRAEVTCPVSSGHA